MTVLDHPAGRPPGQYFTQTVSALGHLLELRLDDALREEGITARQFTALLHISEGSGLHRVSLARILHISPQAAAGLTRRLGDRGLIERLYTDRTSPITFSIKDLGRSCLAKAGPIVAAVEAETLAYLSDHTAETLAKAVTNLVHEVDRRPIGVAVEHSELAR